MAILTFDPPVAPSPGSAKMVQPRVLRVSFGDGYSQRAQDGLNHLPQSWDLKWDWLSAADADAIEGFFVATGGCQAFLWSPTDLPEGGAPLKFTVDQWTRTAFAGAKDPEDRSYALSAKFTQVFDLIA